MDSLELFKDFKKRVIQYYLDNDCDNYTIEFEENWRGYGIHCHQITGRLLVTLYYNKYNSMCFSYYLTACTDYGRDCILDEIRKELEQCKDKSGKIKSEWQNKTFAEWIEMFPEDTHIDIYSYGCWCMWCTIKGFLEDLKEEQKSVFPDYRYRCISRGIVKKIYQDPKDHERIIFDVQGDDVHLWNRTMMENMENKDPNRDMMPGLRVPLKPGVDVYDLFSKRKEEWRQQPFYIDNFAVSHLSNTECLM